MMERKTLVKIIQEIFFRNLPQLYCCLAFDMSNQKNTGQRISSIDYQILFHEHMFLMIKVKSYIKYLTTMF